MSAKADPIFRFMEKVEVGQHCWIWHGAVSSLGYGNFGVWPSTISAHRFAYMTFVGAVPDGLVLDHECHNRDATCPGGPTCPHRRCVNPNHLVPRTRRENTLRGRGATAVNATKTQCLRGHEYTPENTYVSRDGSRSCIECRGMLWRRFAAVHRVPSRIANSAKTECVNGHPFTVENTYIPPSRHHRMCRACLRDRKASARRAVG